MGSFRSTPRQIGLWKECSKTIGFRLGNLHLCAGSLLRRAKTQNEGGGAGGWEVPWGVGMATSNPLWSLYNDTIITPPKNLTLVDKVPILVLH